MNSLYKYPYNGIGTVYGKKLPNNQNEPVVISAPCKWNEQNGAYYQHDSDGNPARMCNAQLITAKKKINHILNF